MSESTKYFYEFGPYRLDVANRLLLRGGEPLPLTPKAVDTLLALIRHGGEILRKDDLMRLVWPDHVVEEGNLTQHIYLLRKTLGQETGGLHYIETLPRRGYRFVGEVRTVEEGSVENLQLKTEDNRQSRAPSPVTSIETRRSLKTPVLLCAAAIILASAVFYTRYSGRPKVAASLASTQGDAMRKSTAQPMAENTEALQAYTKGRYYWSKQTTPALEESIKYFQQALSRDPDFALAYAGLSDSYADLSAHYDGQEQSQQDALPKAKEAALRALKLNNLSAEAHTALAVVRQRYDWDWKGAENEFKSAIELNPDYAYAHQAYALHLAAMDRLDAARTEIECARALDSQSLSINRDAGRIFYFARDYGRAAEQFRAALQIDMFEPLSIPLRRLLAWTYLNDGKEKDALGEFAEILRLQQTSPERIDALRRAFDAGGMKGYWTSWLQMQQERIRRGVLSPFYLSQIYSYLGLTDRAFSYLEKAYADHSIGLAALRYDPSFDALRSDPRYTALINRLGLTKEASH